jgi:hypothetical protein
MNFAWPSFITYSITNFSTFVFFFLINHFIY